MKGSDKYFWKSRKQKKKVYIFFDSKKVTESNRFHLSSPDLFLTMKSICGTRSDRMRKEWKEEKEKKEPSTKLDPRYCQIYPRRFENPWIQRPDAGMLRWSNLMIFMQRACATYVPSISSSWIFNLLYDATFFFFNFSLWVLRFRGSETKTKLKDV